MANIRHGLIVLAVLGAHGVASALTASDFGKLYEGTGTAVDLNNASQVLVRDTASFTIVDTTQGTRNAVGLTAELQQAGYTSITANDLSNTGYVTGFLNGTTPFLWSASTGFRIVPVGFGGKFVNDSGVTVGASGTWSPTTGQTTALTIPGTVTAFNNVGQIGFVSGFNAYPGNPGGSSSAGVVGPAGENVLYLSFPVSAPTGSPSIDDAYAMPDMLVMNDANLVALGFAGVKAYSSYTKLYTNAVAGNSYYSTVAVSINNKGQMVGQETGNALNNAFCACYTDTQTGETVNLSPAWGISPLLRINDSGVILQDKGSTFALYKAGAGTPPPPVEPPPPVIPVGTGTGLKGQYFNTGLFGNTLVTTRIENPNFDWGTSSPAPGVHADFFSVKWTGSVQAEEAGVYRFRTLSDEGVRVTVNGQKVIDHWKAHTAATDTSADITLEVGKRYDIMIEYYDLLGRAAMQLSWLKPGAAAYAPVPTTRLYQP